MGLYRSLRRTNTTQRNAEPMKAKREPRVDTFLTPEAAALCGHWCANNDCPGLLTSNQNVRLHSCEAGTKCSAIQSADVVWIKPIITRSGDGIDIPEFGAGGGGGDLTQVHEIDMTDTEMVIELRDICLRETDDRATRHRIKGLFKKAIEAPSRKMSLAGLDVGTLDHDISLKDFAKLLVRALEQGEPTVAGLMRKLPRSIVRQTFEVASIDANIG